MKRQPELEIRTEKVADLVPYANNAKLHSQAQIDTIANSIAEFGNCDPIAVWHNPEDDMEIVEGHGRVLALKKLGIEEAPVIYLDHLSDEQRRAYAHVHNQTTLNSGFDVEILDMELEELDFDWEEFGFDGFDTAESTVLDSLEDADEPDTIECRCKPGDVWQLGEHRIMCGSSACSEDMKTLCGGGVAPRMVFTDPPYGVAIGTKNRVLSEHGEKGGRIVEDIEGDTLAPDELYEMLVAAFTNVREACDESCSYYVTSPQGGELGLMMMMMMMKDAGLPVRHMLVWNKSSATFSMGRLDYDYKHEPIFYTWGKRHEFYGENEVTVWDFDKPRKCDLHPTMKPVGLIGRALANSSKRGDVVLDAFAGSGSTIVACEQMGRVCYAMEIDPHYCDVSIARWEELTGKTATLLVRA